MSSGRPGDGCTDPRIPHPHWCGFCGAEVWYHPMTCDRLPFVPSCPRCGGTDWRTEVDELTAPDHREAI